MYVASWSIDLQHSTTKHSEDIKKIIMCEVTLKFYLKKGTSKMRLKRKPIASQEEKIYRAKTKNINPTTIR